MTNCVVSFRICIQLMTKLTCSTPVHTQCYSLSETPVAAVTTEITVNMAHFRIYFIHVLLFLLAFKSYATKNYSIDDYNSPVFPTVLPYLPYNGTGLYKKLIPQHIWIAVRNISDGRPTHLLEFAKVSLSTLQWLWVITNLSKDSGCYKPREGWCSETLCP